MESNKVNNILIIGLIGAAFLIGYLLNKNSSSSNTQTNNQAQQQQQQPTQATISIKIEDVKKLFTKDHITFGKPDSKLIFVEVSDPSCPYCHVAAGVNPELAEQVNPNFKYQSKGGSYQPPVLAMKKLVDQGKASLVYLYANGHGNGELATQALYCAYDNNKYWPVHDLLMSNSGYELLNTKLDKAGDSAKNINMMADFLAKAIGKDVIKKCLTSGQYKDRLTRDQQIATSLGYQGTPYFLVNTEPFSGAYSFKDMQAAVDKVLK